MIDWINKKTHLQGESVNLIPLEKDHFPELIKVASNKKIWEFYTLDGSNPIKISQELDKALIEMEKGMQFPFVIIHNNTNKIIGSTRLLDIQAEHKKLEIGWTWMASQYWASEINLECKLLLLTFCFEKLHAVRVQLKTDERNLRSRKAIEKIGGKFEGILRHEMLRDNGTMRSSAIYSIIESEWNELKPRLSDLYLGKKMLAANSTLLKSGGCEMTTDILFNGRVILNKLTECDADFLYNIYSRPELLTDFGNSPFLSRETPQQFTIRIISACEFIWTIRQVSNPNLVIGDCALHNWNKDKAEIVIGGSLLPEYWGQGIMQSAFDMLIEVAREHLRVKVILGLTKTRNLKAIRLVEKMGFEKTTVNDQDTIMRKVIAN